MDWKQIDPYHMRSGFGHGSYYIAKASVKGVARHLLSSVRRTVNDDQTATYTDVIHGAFDSEDDAKRAAEQMVGLDDADGSSDGVRDPVRDRVGANAGGGST